MMWIAAALALALQDAKPPAPAAPPPVDEAQVDSAIRKGIAWLRTAPSPATHAGLKDSDELILWTYLHAGIKESDPDFQKLFKKMVDGPLEKTYKVALQAMILEEIDRVKHQERIAQCAQFLVDNQCVNGQWGYGSPTPFAAEVKVPENKAVSTPAAPVGGTREFAPAEEKKKPKVVQKVAVKKQKEGSAAGDNSNTQYAALGLRACHDSGILLPENVLVLAVKWWRESQQADTDKDGKAVATGGFSEKAEGWNYKDAASQPDKKPYASMTAGGTSSLVIYDYILGRRWKEDSHVKQGMAWLARHWTIGRNFYYLYGLERTGILFGTDRFGGHFWYPEGATFLLKDQNADGSWGRRKPEDKDRLTHDTCFAILFLKKATRPLVASEDRK